MDYKRLFFSFEGRISRQTYWTAVVVFIAANIATSVVASLAGEGLGAAITMIVMLAVGYAGLAVSAKRWHDRNKSGWWSLIALVPVIGAVWMLIELGFLPGTHGRNRFGADPVRPHPVTHEGQTYFRHRDGSFTDHSGTPIRDAVLIASLVAAFAALQPNLADSSDWHSSALDRIGESSDRDAGDSSFDSDSGGFDGGSD